MLRSDVGRVAQIVARVFLLAAVASVFLPEDTRLGGWLPLHLALAGAASCAIAGAMPDFAAALVAGRTPRWVWAPLAGFAIGAATIALGRPAGERWLVAVGGVAFAAGAFTLFLTVDWTRRHALNRRHAAVIVAYELAAIAPIVGGTLGALLGGGAIDGSEYLPARSAHLVVQLFGFLVLTVAATDVLLLPTVLRTRPAPWHPGRSLGAIAAGAAAAAVGVGVEVPVVAALGALVLLAGVVGVAVFAVRAALSRPPAAEAGAASFLMGGIAWMLAAAALLAWLTATDAIVERGGAIVAAVAAGVVVQSLLGAWSYLVPMRAPGGPHVHRALLARASRGAPVQTAVLNVGVAALVAGGWSGTAIWSRAGAVLLAAAVVVVIAKVSLPPRGPDLIRPP